jgi:hypothetical protein
MTHWTTSKSGITFYVFPAFPFPIVKPVTLTQIDRFEHFFLHTIEAAQKMDKDKGQLSCHGSIS